MVQLKVPLRSMNKWEHAVPRESGLGTALPRVPASYNHRFFSDLRYRFLFTSYRLKADCTNAG
jgi:hypothetical protein